MIAPLADVDRLKRNDRQAWEEVAERRFHAQRLWRQAHDDTSLRLLFEWLSPSAQRILKTDLFEEAASTGLLPLLPASATIRTGVDLSRTTARRARERDFGGHAIVADVRQLPFADRSYDAIVSTSTLDHFDGTASIRRALAELRRILRPGGDLILTIDNADNPLVRLRNALPQRLLQRMGVVPYPVGYAPDRKWLAAVLADVGFEVMACRAVEHAPRLPVVWLGTLTNALRWQSLDRTILGLIGAMEGLERLPTRYMTGYFIAVHARRTG